MKYKITSIAIPNKDVDDIEVELPDGIVGLNMVFATSGYCHISFLEPVTQPGEIVQSS